jgi:competence protein ComGC
LSYYTARNNKIKGSISLESCTVQIVSGADRTDGKTCLMIINNGITDEENSSQRNSVALQKQPSGKDLDEEDKPERVLYFDIALEKGEKGNPDELRQEWLTAITTRISILQYTKKCKQKKMAEDIDLIEFFTKGSVATDVHVNKPLIIEGVIAMVDPLRDHQNLKILDLCHAQIGNEGLLTLIPALESNNSISTLNLSDCLLGFSSIAEFSKLIVEKSTNIKSLDLSQNLIDDNSLSAFSASLAKNKVLTHLNLSDNAFGGEKMEEFVDALINGELKIPKLYLNKNQIGDTGCNALAKLLSSKYILKELHITHNKIGNEGSKLLAKSLAKNKDLTFLNMEYNEIGYAGAKQLAFMIVVRF